MTDRPATLVRVEDDEGAFGWGEIWCNFPTCGAEHRARLVDSVLAPLLVGQSFCGPEQARKSLLSATRILTLQTREYGPIAQALAGIDVALWDLAARRCALPLGRLLGGRGDCVPVYASGINRELVERRIDESRSLGYDAFKVKIGFEPNADRMTVDSALSCLESRERLMLDANQAWDRITAIDIAQRLQNERIGWLEEPMPVDAPDADWVELSKASPLPLAGGENFADSADFDHAVDLGALSVLQPDVCKWGGVSGCFPVAQRALKAGRRVCPHYLGGGIGLIASAHLLAAVGGDGLL
jgi:L-alanine-DL-glutamate epimerase-like enolase superfamily enzyme